MRGLQVQGDKARGGVHRAAILQKVLHADGAGRSDGGVQKDEEAMSYDPKCGELATYFLQGDRIFSASDPDAAAAALAQHIQDAIESWTSSPEIFWKGFVAAEPCCHDPRCPTSGPPYEVLHPKRNNQ
jgi:hypothetical protein